MHTLEKLSLNCGVSPLKLNKPEIYTSFYPVEADKYIVIQTGSEMPSQNYSYYQDIVDFIYNESQDSGYKIVQIGSGSDQYLSKCINLQGKINIHQACFIIKNASFFLGSDSFSTHVSSSYGVPSVSLYSTARAEVSGPYWKNEKQLTITAPSNGKKTEATQEDEYKSIDKIKPEQILEKIAKVIPEINLSNKKKLESIFFGKAYPKASMELVPDSLIEIDKGKNLPLVIRFDYLKSNEISDSNIDCALINLAKRKCDIITSKVLNIEKFKNEEVKQNILLFIIHIEKKHLKDVDSLIQFILDLKNIGINARAALIEKNFSEEEIGDLKLKFLNMQQIALLNETSWSECIDKNSISKINDLTIFKSCRIIFSNGKSYLSKTALDENKPSNGMQQNLSEIKNLNSLGKELENCYIYNL
jgi:hypothetical protein